MDVRFGAALTDLKPGMAPCAKKKVPGNRQGPLHSIPPRRHGEASIGGIRQVRSIFGAVLRIDHQNSNLVGCSISGEKDHGFCARANILST